MARAIKNGAIIRYDAATEEYLVIKVQNNKTYYIIRTPYHINALEAANDMARDVQKNIFTDPATDAEMNPNKLPYGYTVMGLFALSEMFN